MSQTVLLIEDNADIRESTAELLLLTGYRVITADNGRTGVQLAVSSIPDIILCDIMMPELDGYGVLYMLGKNPATAHIPLIFITAKSEKEDIRKGMGLGADDYLTKPFDEMDLLRSIEVRLQKKDTPAPASLMPAPDHQNQIKLVDDLLKKGRNRLYRKKQQIYETDDLPVNIYHLKSGQVRSYVTFKDGRELSTGIYTGGDFFGYEPVITDTAYKESAIALDDSEVILIPKQEFKDILSRNAALADKFMRLLSGNIQGKYDELLKLAYYSVRKRIAEALLILAGKSGASAGSCQLKISREDLASMVGTATETVSRTLADFKDEGLIEKEGHFLGIPSVEKLRQVKQ